jgi:hypothetical protein
MSANGRIRHPSCGTSIVPFDAHRLGRGRPKAPAATRLLRSNKVKILVAILIAVVPVYAQAQSPSAPKVTKAEAQKVVKIISGNKTKTQTYCDMAKLFNQIERAGEKNIGNRREATVRAFAA